jgi:hypothetical protein
MLTSRSLFLLSIVVVLACGGKAPIQKGAAGSTGSAGSGGTSGSFGGTGGASGGAGGASAGAGGASGGGGGVSGAGGGGSSGSGGASGSGGDGGAAGFACRGSTVGAAAPAHRPTAAACPATVGGGIPERDGGVVSCTTDADCAPDGSPTIFSQCLNHQCGADECLTDADCGAGKACLCASEQGHRNIIHVNRCVQTGCNVDADCASGLCSPGGTGFQCRGSADTCRVDADCAACGPGPGIGWTCAFWSDAGHWSCVPYYPING